MISPLAIAVMLYASLVLYVLLYVIDWKAVSPLSLRPLWRLELRDNFIALVAVLLVIGLFFILGYGQGRGMKIGYIQVPQEAKQR